MQSDDIFALGLGLTAPWKLMEQQFDTTESPHRLDLRIAADRSSLYPCPECGRPCKFHDFKEMTWLHLNFFQHHCYITAPVPRTDCPEHGIKRIVVPWAREGSHFTLLFEQVALTMLREMSVTVAAHQSGAFISSIKTHFKNAELTADCFHVVQLFTRAVDEVRRAKAKEIARPKTTRWAVLKNADGALTSHQFDAFVELAAMDFHHATAWRFKEALRWIRKAPIEQGAKWRLSNFLNYARELIGQEPILAPVRKALYTVEKHRQAIVDRWRSDHSNAHLEGLNSFFQVAKARARRHRKDLSFISIIYLRGAPNQDLLVST